MCDMIFLSKLLNIGEQSSAGGNRAPSQRPSPARADTLIAARGGTPVLILREPFTADSPTRVRATHPDWLGMESHP